MFEFYVVRCDSTNGYPKKKKDSKEIELCAHNMITILDSIVNIIEEALLWPLIEHENLHFDHE